MFGQRLKYLRNGMKMNQGEIAEFLEMDRSTIGKWENGSSHPDFDNLVNLSKFFDVSTDYLLGKTDIKNPYSDEMDDTIDYSFIQIGYRIKSLRENKGLSKKELADILNTSKSVIKLYENGLRNPGYENLITLAYTFDVSSDYLLGLSDSKTLEIDRDSAEILNGYRELKRDNREKLKDYLRLLKLDE